MQQLAVLVHVADQAPHDRNYAGRILKTAGQLPPGHGISGNGSRGTAHPQEAVLQGLSPSNNVPVERLDFKRVTGRLVDKTLTLGRPACPICFQAAASFNLLQIGVGDPRSLAHPNGTSTPGTVGRGSWLGRSGGGRGSSAGVSLACVAVAAPISSAPFSSSTDCGSVSFRNSWASCRRSAIRSG